MSKIDDATRLKMQQDYIEGRMSLRAIGKKYGVTGQCVSRISKREGWTSNRIARNVVQKCAQTEGIANGIKDKDISPVMKAGIVAALLNDLFERIIDEIGKQTPEQIFESIRYITPIAAAIRTNQLTIMQAYGIMSPAETQRMELLKKQAEADMQSNEPQEVKVTFSILGDMEGDPTV